MGNVSVLYGPYDCVANAFLFLMDKFNMDAGKLYSFNWDIQFVKDKNFLSGGVKTSELLSFLDQVYSLCTNKLDFYEIPVNEYVILVLDTYYLSFSTFFENTHMEHCVVCRRLKSHYFEIHDPYFNKSMIISAIECYNLWEKSKGDILHVVKQDNLNSKKIIYPYILNTDYRTTYREIINEINNLQISLNWNESIFLRYFGMIRGISAIREKHLGNFYFAEKNEQITMLWRKVEKELFKLHQSGGKTINDFEASLKIVFEREMVYLEKISQSMSLQ